MEADAFESTKDSVETNMLFRHEDGHDVLDKYITHFGLYGDHITHFEQSIKVGDIDCIYEDITGSEIPPLRSWPVFKPQRPRLH